MHPSCPGSALPLSPTSCHPIALPPGLDMALPGGAIPFQPLSGCCRQVSFFKAILFRFLVANLSSCAGSSLQASFLAPPIPSSYGLVFLGCLLFSLLPYMLPWKFHPLLSLIKGRLMSTSPAQSSSSAPHPNIHPIACQTFPLAHPIATSNSPFPKLA